MKNSGKTTVIFLSLFVVILLSLSSISIFRLNKEIDKRKSVETELNRAQESVSQLQGELKVAQNKAFILEEKNKEADMRINSLEEELDVEQGLKEAIKSQNDKLKSDLDAALQDKEKVQGELAKQLEEAQNKAKTVEESLVAQQERVKELENKLSQAVSSQQSPDVSSQDVPSEQVVTEPPVEKTDEQTAEPAQKVELDKIVVDANGSVKGRVLSVDKETEFIIFDLGTKNGIKQGDLMSVMRGDDYLGDVKVSRVQNEMSAADLIPPFSSRMVRKNDTIVPKQ